MTPASGAALVAGPRRRCTPRSAGAGAASGPAATSTGGLGSSPRSGAERRRPAGDGDAHPGERRRRWRRAAPRRTAARSSSSVNGRSRPRPAADRRRRSRWRRSGEGHAVDRLEGLEHAVADGEAVVEDRHAGLAGGTSSPSSHTCPSDVRRQPPARSLPTSPDATWSRRRALSSVSAHSSSGSLSQVMPPPVPKCSCAVLRPRTCGWRR